ncbi:hypothetical protein LTR70_009145 [Exophiala xenobiotica]|uniref:Uncharacterized protein n=1 Tax=Lithohypha guttulata TaxID=1690604 RepID=A0ABR0JZ39_9EURO|nr:hypothetical protein LTR24_008888 [Lithohypha guttulata]KAK5310893.1 hypothetical protein LTR70_009145 [Exophiala xenobiotica]
MAQKFTGHLYIGEDVNNPNLEDCWCKGVHQASADIPNTFSSVHCETDRGFYELRTLFLQIPPNMKMAVARCKETLFDGPTYGFGEESFFVRVVSEEKLKALMLSKMQGWKRDTAYYWSLKDLWGAGVRTIVEMVVAMGSPPMRFEFMCIFLLKDFDADPVVLGKFTMQEWRSSLIGDRLCQSHKVEVDTSKAGTGQVENTHKTSHLTVTQDQPAANALIGLESIGAHLVNGTNVTGDMTAKEEDTNSDGALPKAALKTYLDRLAAVAQGHMTGEAQRRRWHD